MTACDDGDDRRGEEGDDELFPKLTGQGAQGARDWDGSRRSWTGNPEDGSWIEQAPGEPGRYRMRIPQAAPEPEPEPRPEPPPEPVGYGRPPREHRFRPGQSGNPKGRPLGSKNKQPARWGERMREIVKKEAYREITVRDGDELVTIPVAQAVMRSVAVNAAKGQPRAQQLFMDMVTGLEAEEAREHQAFVMQSLEYKFAAEQEIARRKRQGITDHSDIVPHPDDIIIDFEADTIRVNGPQTAEQKEAWRWLVEQRETLQRAISSQKGKLRRQRKPESRAHTQHFIDVLEQTLAELNATMPDWVVRD